jgi:LPXTG-site transpeptidase (sortase) family protein
MDVFGVFTMRSPESRFGILVDMKQLKAAMADRRLILGATMSGVSLLLMGIGLFAVVSGLTSDSVQLPNQGSIQDILANNPGDGGSVTQPGAEPTPPSGPRPVRLTISRIDVDAPVIELNVEPGTTTPAVPTEGYQAAWYDFSATPGVGSNAVFAGHVDWQTPKGLPIAGAFYRLRELHIGDDIAVTLDDGSTLHYRVTGNVAVKYDDPNVVKSMGLTSKDVVTLITCGGTWVKNASEENGGNYSHRIIVRAERATDAAPTQAAG